MQLVILGDYSQLVSYNDTRNMLINSRELISQLVCLRHTRRSYVYDILHNPQLVLLCNTRKDTGSSGKLTSPLIETRQLTFGSYRWLSAVYTHIVSSTKRLCSHTTEVSQPFKPMQHLEPKPNTKEQVRSYLLLQRITQLPFVEEVLAHPTVKHVGFAKDSRLLTTAGSSCDENTLVF